MNTRQWLGLGVIAILLIAGWIAFSHPNMLQGHGDVDAAQLVYWLMAAMLVSGSVAAVSRRTAGSPGPGVLTSALIWGGVIGVLMLLYRAGEIWSVLLSFFR